jgi:DivIVA domain-containing protein
MELSASDIRNRSFSSGLRGLDEEEVYSFLNQVADQWDELEERVNALQAKLDEIGDSAGKARRAKERAEELKEEVQARKQRLDEREQALERRERDLDEREDEVETKQSELQSVAKRLQDVVRQEQETLSRIAPDGATPEPATTTERSNGQSASDTSSESTESKEESQEKTTEEWVDSLFPNRLPGNEPTATSDTSDIGEEEEEEEEDVSASKSQFEAIKQDVQGMDAEEDDAAEEEDDGPDTEEMDRIWDVFDDQGKK